MAKKKELENVIVEDNNIIEETIEVNQESAASDVADMETTEEQVVQDAEQILAEESDTIEETIQIAEQPEQETTTEAETGEIEGIEDGKIEVEGNEPAPRKRATKAPTVKGKATNASLVNYMGDFYKIENPELAYKSEIERIKSVIAHNKKTAKAGKRDFIFLTAMMTGVEQYRGAKSFQSMMSVSISALEVINKDNKLGTIKLMFAGDDFTAYSGLAIEEGETEKELAIRQLRYVSRQAGCKFQFVPIQLEINPETNTPFVICSRAFVMEQQQNYFFFGKEPVAKLHDNVPAYILAVDANGVRVECMGYETRINRGKLTSRQFIEDATQHYKVGMAIDVAISRLKIDKEERTVDFILSGVLREKQLGLVKSVEEIDLDKHPRELAQIISESSSHFVARLVNLGVIGLIPKDKIMHGAQLSIHDNVFMEITGTSVDYNRVIGGCVKI